MSQTYTIEATAEVNGRVYGKLGTSQAWSDANAKLFAGAVTYPGGVATGTRAQDALAADLTPSPTAQGVCVWTGVLAGLYSAAINHQGGSHWCAWPRYTMFRVGDPEPAYLRIDGDYSLGPWTLDFDGAARKTWTRCLLYYMSSTVMLPGIDFEVGVDGTTVSIIAGRLPRDPLMGATLTPDEHVTALWDYLPGGGY